MKDKIAGALYGMALGDAMGMPSELWGRKKVREYFGLIEGFLDGPKENDIACNYKKGQFTDDTGQALVLIESLAATKFKPSRQDIARRFLVWADENDAFENNILGPTSKLALEGFRKKEDVSPITDQALSNGSAMRIAPIGCLFSSKEEKRLAQYVYQVSSATHSSDVTIEGAAMIAMAVSSALENEDFDKVMEDALAIGPIARDLGAETYSPSLVERTKLGIYLADKYESKDLEFLDKIYDLIGAGVNISESVPAALALAYYCQDPNKAALMCANLAGDTDTIGAMATAICGAFRGKKAIKKEYIETLERQNKVNFDFYVEKLMEGREILR